MAVDADWALRAERAAHRRDRQLDAETRRSNGVVHTPPAVARWVAAEAHAALCGELGLAAGLADPSVTIVDPACGPGVFLAAALDVAGALGAPHAVLGVDLDKRATDVAQETFGEDFKAAGWPLMFRTRDALVDLEVGPVRADDGVCVVLGNPPWLARGARAGAFVDSLMGEFRRDSTGSPLRERKSGVLSDAYVHFLRWGAEKVRRAPGGGVLAFVTNASYLDGPVHRGIRGALLEWFDDLRVVDLGGSALVARRGVVDENLFGVRPAAAVLVAVTRGGGLRGSDVSRDVTRGSRVGFTRLDGTRQQKLAAMAGPLESEPVFPAGPGFLFRPMPSVPAAYGRWPSLPELMPFHAEGVQTNRDEVVVAQSREELVERVRRFAFGSNDDDLHAACARLPHYDPDRARAALRDAMSADPDGIGDGWVRPLAWRPFDTRWFVPVAPFCHRPRPKLLRAIDGRTPMLLTVRKDRGERPWSHAAASTVIPDNCFLSSRSSCRTRAFPCRTPSGTPNLDREALTRSWPPAVAARVEPASLVAFALAVLSAPAYRQLGDAFLHVDYPRIPPPPDLETFDAVVAAGRAIAHALTMPDGEPGMPPPDPWRALGHTGRVTDSWLRAVDAANDVVQPWLPSF